MEVGDTVKFKFGKAKKQMEGRVVKVSPKKVRLAVDFPKQKGKIIVRRHHEVS